jgi:hypothetical protein
VRLLEHGVLLAVSREMWRWRGVTNLRILEDVYLKEEALDRTMWRARFGRGLGPVVRQTTK